MEEHYSTIEDAEEVGIDEHFSVVGESAPMVSGFTYSETDGTPLTDQQTESVSSIVDPYYDGDNKIES